jgi:uroporphyrinogen decarboxylase
MMSSQEYTMATMRERFYQTVRHERHADLLYYAGFTPDLQRRMSEHVGVSAAELPEHFNMFAPVGVGNRSGRSTSLAERPDLAQYYDEGQYPEGSHVDADGVLRVPGSSYHFTHRVSPLRNADSMEEIEAYPYYHPPIPDDAAMRAAVEAAHADGRVTVCSIGHIYEIAWQIRGYEEFLMDMISEPDRAELILETIAQDNIRRAEAGARAGVDFIRTGDDVANQNTLMFRKDMWQRFIKSRWARVYEAARRIKPDIEIWYHSDGNITDIIPELIDIGVTILNPVQPECMDIHEIKRRYGDKLVLDGTIGTQTTMPFGTTDEVRRTVRSRVRDLGRDGALILSPTHVLEPEVPVENVMAFLETSREPAQFSDGSP